MENERNTELSFCNAVLIKASLFRKKYRRLSDYAFSKKSGFIPTFFREISRKDFWRLLGHPLYALCRTLAGNGFLAELAYGVAFCNRSIHRVTQHIAQSQQRKPAVWSGLLSKLLFHGVWITQASFKTSVNSRHSEIELMWISQTNQRPASNRYAYSAPK